MKLKRMICSILTFVLICSMVSFASAASAFSSVLVTENSETGQVIISGKTSAKTTIAVMVLRQGKSMTDVYNALSNLSSVVLYSQSQKTTADGTFTIFFDMRYAYGQVVESGAYPIVLSNGSIISDGVYSINHVNMEDVRIALATLNGGKAVTDAETAIKEHADTFSLSQDLLEACSLLTTAEKSALYQRFIGQNFEKADDVKAIFERYAPFSVLKSIKDAQNMAQYLTKLNAYYGLSLSDGAFAKIGNTENKTIVYENMIAKGTFQDQKDTAEIFKISAVLGYLNDIIAPGTMLDTLKQYKDEFGIDFSDFNDLSEKKQNKVLSKMVNTQISDSDKVKDAFDDIVVYYESEKETSGGSGGGGSSSSGGKTTSISITGATEPEIAPVITEEGKVIEEKSVFSDLKSVSWAKSAILSLYNKGIINGMQDGSFMPNNKVTRAEFIKMVTLAFAMQNKGTDISFADVEQGAWYYSSVKTAAENGIVTGNEQGAFAPDSPISREDIAVILTRVAQNKGLGLVSGTADFTDESSISAYAKDAVGIMQASGIVSGVGDNRFAPKSHATRAEASKMIYEILNK